MSKVSAGLMLAILLAANVKVEAVPPTDEVGDRIQIPQQELRRDRRPIDLIDILSIREVAEARLSPDGKHVAYLVRQAFLDCNCSRVALYVTGVQAHEEPLKLLEESELQGIQWAPGGQAISYLAAPDGTMQLWEVDVQNGGRQRVIPRSAVGEPISAEAQARSIGAALQGVIDYQWSHDGRTIAYITEAPRDEKRKERAEQEGFLYSDLTMRTDEIFGAGKSTGDRSLELRLYDLSRQKETVVWKTPAGAEPLIRALSWSPDDRRIAVSFTNVAQLADSIVTVPADGGTARPLPAQNGIVSGFAWAPDGSTMAVVSWPQGTTHGRILTTSLETPRWHELAAGITNDYPEWLYWDSATNRLYFAGLGTGQTRTKTGLFYTRLNSGEIRQLTSSSEKVSNCDKPVGRLVACVIQSPTRAPGPALIDLDTGTARGVADVNPELGSIELAPVQELVWRNSYNIETNGYLLLPSLGAPSRLPLVVMAYGFSGDFVATASPSLNTYPAQAFARDGVAVLLVNYPRWEDWKGPNFALGSVAWGYSPLSSLKAIIDELSDKGLVDSGRVGFMGHSWGGFWVEFAMTHSDLFRAAEIHNGGTNSEPGTYWIGGDRAESTLQDHFMGGPAYGPSLTNYLTFSPTLNADKIRSPIMIEAGDEEARREMEFYIALRHNQVPVDFVVYPHESHVFTQPRHRLVSMQRNLDWFEFWLQNKERPDSSVQEQYQRWRAFRDHKQDGKSLE